MKSPLNLIDKKTLKIMLGVILLLTLFSMLIIVFTGILRNDKIKKLEEARYIREQQALTSSLNFGIEDFYLDPENSGGIIVYPSVERRSRWEREDVRKYWIDPSLAGLDKLKEENDKRVFEALGIDGK